MDDLTRLAQAKFSRQALSVAEQKLLRKVQVGEVAFCGG